MEIARLLDEFGIDFIEAGHPASSQKIFQAVQLIAREGLSANILAHCRAVQSDIDAALACDVDWVGIFYCVSKDRLQQDFHKDFETATSIVEGAVQYAKDHGLRVRYTPEDATRTAFTSVVDIANAAINAGADRISVADTVGIMTPMRMHTLITNLKSEITVPIHVHCHNDLGMATANALAAYEAGANTIDVCVNGLGERVGIARLEEVSVALRTIYNKRHDLNLEVLPQLSELVSRHSGMSISEQKPVIGGNAFTHNAGVHVSAVIKNPALYEPYSPELVGRSRKICVDRMAGKHTVRHALASEGFEFSDYILSTVLTEMKNLEKETLTAEKLVRMAFQIQEENPQNAVNLLPERLK